jgi:S-adenosylmethionine/arginine decarboxylase-like enzyme
MFNHQTWTDETDPFALKYIYSRRLKAAGFKVLDLLEHHFKPQGYTALFLLAESHLAIHTFPEEGKAYVELSSCVMDKYLKYLELYGEL